MALKSTNKVETNLYEIEFDVDKATFDAATEKVYRKEVKKISIPGFRKGKAPRAIIEKMYGSEVFYDKLKERKRCARNLQIVTSYTNVNYYYSLRRRMAAI